MRLSHIEHNQNTGDNWATLEAAKQSLKINLSYARIIQHKLNNTYLSVMVWKPGYVGSTVITIESDQEMVATITFHDTYGQDVLLDIDVDAAATLISELAENIRRYEK